ncbi:MAG TPA: hypothetical protein VED40_11965 [Azospirillaceae bacterium]|nr:hypothetical protein [Azospirillaceae bacterium]
MAQIKKPSHDQSVSSQLEAGAHPRGTDAKNQGRDGQPRQAPKVGGGNDADRPEGEQAQGRTIGQGAGKHTGYVPDRPGDLERNPGIGSGGGTSVDGGDGPLEGDRS